jgi:hypothetical protein
MTDEQRARYQQMVRNGVKPILAEMLALQSPPGVKTDATYFRNARDVAHLVAEEPEYALPVLQKAKSLGYKPRASDVYEPGLAKFPGDPAAFVPQTGGRAHIKKVLERRGWGASGTVTTKARQPERDPLEGTPAQAERGPPNPVVDDLKRKLLKKAGRKVAAQKAR